MFYNINIITIAWKAISWLTHHFKGIKAVGEADCEEKYVNREEDSQEKKKRVSWCSQLTCHLQCSYSVSECMVQGGPGYFWPSFLLMDLGRRQLMVQRLGFLLPRWETQMDFASPGSNQALTVAAIWGVDQREWTREWEIFFFF